MRFIQTMRKSIHDVSFYASVKTEDSTAALKYYSLLVLCVAVVISIPLYLSFGTWYSQMKEDGDIRTRVLAVYPDELVLNFQDGKVISNVEEPYFIPLPSEFVTADAPKNIVVIDTLGDVTLADFEKYDTAAILTSDAVWVYDAQKNKVEIQKFDTFNKESFVLNEQKVTEFTDIALKFGKVIMVIVLIFLPFIIFSFLWFGYLFYLIFGAVIIWLVAKMRKVEITYGQAYKIGLYMLTLPILYAAIASGPLAMFKVPYVFTLILAIVAYVNLAPRKIIEAIKQTAISAEQSNLN